MAKKQAFEYFVQQFIDALKRGIVPWHKPWKSLGRPRNAETGREYTGANPFWLAYASIVNNWSDPRWATKKAIERKGATIKQSELGNSQIVIYWKMNFEEVTNEKTGKTEQVLKSAYPLYHRVYNVEQLEDPTVFGEFTDDLNEVNPDTLSVIEGVYEGYPDAPPYQLGTTRAFYATVQDIVFLPHPQQFETTNDYGLTFFHELVHSTGHSSRLNRFDLNKLGDTKKKDYSFEELIAEMGAAWLANTVGILTESMQQNSDNYINGWIRALESDPMMLIKAGTQAFNAVEYILGNPVAQY